MPKKRFSAKQIVTLLRQIEVVMGQGKSAQLPAGRQGFRNRVLGRTAQRRNLQPSQGSPSAHQAMAPSLQHRQATLVPRLSTARATDLDAGNAPSGYEAGYAAQCRASSF
jgi:hypothetical protein